MGELMTPSEFGRLLKPPLSPAGVRAAADAGRIKVALRTLGGMRLFARDELVRFQREREREAKVGA